MKAIYTLVGALGTGTEYFFYDKKLAKQSARLHNIALEAHGDQETERLSVSKIAILDKVPFRRGEGGRR